MAFNLNETKINLKEKITNLEETELRVIYTFTANKCFRNLMLS